MKKETVHSSSDVLREFSTNLQKAVSASGDSPYTLSKNLGLYKDTIKKAMREGYDPKLSTVIRIAKGLKVSLDRLVGIPTGDGRNEHANLFRIVDQMYENDVELLEDVARLLLERRSRYMEKLIKAIRDRKRSDKSKEEGLMTKYTKSWADIDDDEDDDFDDEDVDEDEDFDDEDEFDEDDFDDDEDD